MTQDELKKAVGWAAAVCTTGHYRWGRYGLDGGALYRCAGYHERANRRGGFSSDASTEKTEKSLGITVFDLNSVDRLGIYVDGADEINGHMQMIRAVAQR